MNPQDSPKHAAETPDASAADAAPPAAHHDSVGQPHDVAQEGPVAVAEARAEEISTHEQPMGRPGRSWNHRSPFLIAIAASAGVVVTVAGVEVIITARDVLILIGLALFIAVGLEPATSWLARRMPRWVAVTTVVLGFFAAVGGFIAAAIPPLVDQGGAFITAAPDYVKTLTDHSSFLGQLNDRFHIQQSVEQSLNSSGGSIAQGVLGAGAVVVSALGSALIVIVLTIYFLSALPRLRTGLYRLIPASRRPRAILLGDEVAAKVGAYVLGNAVISLIAAILTFVFLLILGVPYPLLLAVLVAVLDLIPVIGSTVAGVIVVLVALTVSLPAALVTAAFFVIYRFVEDYVLVPKIIGGVVKVSALATVVAVLFGGVLFGIIGALVAIPIAAGIQLITREVAFPRLDTT